MFKKFTSEDNWLVMCLCGATIAAVGFFFHTEGSLAENLGLVPAVSVVENVRLVTPSAHAQVGQAVASPFLDALSERTEAIVMGEEPPPFSLARSIRGMLLAVLDLVWGLLYLAAVHVPLLIISAVVPVRRRTTRPGRPPAKIITFSRVMLVP